MRSQVRQKLDLYIHTFVDKLKQNGMTLEDLRPSHRAIINDLDTLLARQDLSTTHILFCRLAKNNSYYLSPAMYKRILARRWGLPLASIDMGDVLCVLAQILDEVDDGMSVYELIRELSPDKDFFYFNGVFDRYQSKASCAQSSYDLRAMDRMVYAIRHMDVEKLPGFVTPLWYRNYEKQNQSENCEWETCGTKNQ